ncbi:hypothetical protein CIHG_06915 [Coccidioides immitis H538.4]|uniref:Uncharacterized protein n=3 Tax=Coccidioides immitis TaxID=5501 RepID=A0A0J8R066_COCIT|nr:hypothetical protein CIRG_09960 [Coccidioides immitis RMSCC 2394]KMU78549.1 hypothetical protein CISG_07209 [Coccidioides immitis RMSCC 3703]KMU89245.1 hypothetical protein CIHG_06915 [Coccidioides immitis H538.4]
MPLTFHAEHELEIIDRPSVRGRPGAISERLLEARSPNKLDSRTVNARTLPLQVEMLAVDSDEAHDPFLPPRPPFPSLTLAKIAKGDAHFPTSGYLGSASVLGWLQRPRSVTAW